MKKSKYLKHGFLFLVCISMLFINTLSTNAKQKNVTLSSLTFDVDYYYNTNADLQVAFGYDYDALYNHYVKYGLKEGRSGSKEFNCKIYRNNYRDLRKAYKNDYLSYCSHYELYGKAEGRNATDILVTPDESLETSTGAPTVLGTYTTEYDATIQRATNVELAASRINGVTLAPGESFSFSSTILPRTAANGYVKATVISGGEYTIGMGGGVCQVSSTLYAAMLDAELPATEHHYHSLPVSYMPVGMDATISGTSKDLKFENIFDYTISISATATDGTLTVSITK